jgi:hypothetical protein
MKIVIGILVVLAAAASWLVWDLHPWTPVGRVIALGKWQFDEFEFQAWQRKNPDTFEPFADGLFVRRGTNRWEAFCFDIQDGYSPRVRLERVGSQVTVYRGGERRGVYDLATQTFRRHEQPFTPTYIDGAPPGNWWLRSSQ